MTWTTLQHMTAGGVDDVKRDAENNPMEVGEIPCQRTHHSVVSYNRSCFIYGGINQWNLSGGEMYRFDIGNLFVF